MVEAVPAWAPRNAEDDRPFEEYASRRNVFRVSDRRVLFVNQVRRAVCAAGPAARVLDIGCGHGIGDSPEEGPEYLAGVRAVAGELWGVEPDATAVPAHGHFDSHQHAFLEEAQLPSGYFDVAYAYYVVEHVADPGRFLAAVSRVLKPGGVFIAMTPNGDHWFTRAGGMLKRLRLDEVVLRLLRGRDQVDAYHYPVSYLLNRPADWRLHGARAGFGTVELATFDNGDVLPYLPRAVRRLYRRVVIGDNSAVHRRERDICLLARLRKGA